MPTIFPLFKPHDWPHQQHVAHRLLTTKVKGAPIIAFGFDAGSNYQFVPQSQCADVEKLYEEALANLAALDYPWELGDSHGLRFAASSGNEFSAEKVLDPTAMRHGHELLEADRIVVASPRRTCLFATRHGLPDAEMALFVQLTMHTYEDDSYGHAPISPALFILDDGIIQDVEFADRKRSAKPWWKFWA